MATINDLKINNTTMPTPAINGVTINREPIWSAATGRTASGKMVGNIVTRKWTLKIKWPPLTMAQAATILTALTAHDFLSVSFTDMTGATRNLTMYAGTPSFTQYSWVDGVQYVVDAAVDLIEQ